MFVGLGPYPLGSEAVSGRWYYYVLNCSIPSLCWRIACKYGEKNTHHDRKDHQTT